MSEKSAISSIGDLWELLLSCNPELVCAAYNLLEEGERQAVVDHLKRMRDEIGWLPQQRHSAEAALAAIQTDFNRES